ncbi:PilW family protein [Aliivibrio salmonicida]|uniref:PilW family protein n=1 Tax=Aliivibrio salmonicida TaxID=40269 RepID=UPI00406C037E
MAIKYASKKQNGSSLVELLVASTIGLIALMLIGSIYVKGQRLYADRSQNLLLIQELNDALRFIKEESHRAGYNGDSHYSAMLSGASNVIHVSGSQMSYVYKTSESPQKWRGVSIKSASDSLKICTKSNLEYIPSINFCTRFYSLLDTNIIRVTDFTLEQKFLGSSISSAHLSISTTAKLKHTSHQYSSEIKIMQRNWR